MHILVANLDKDRPVSVSRSRAHGETVTEVSEIAVNAIAPGVTEGLDLFRLAGDVIGIAVLHVAAGRRPLEIAVELDAIWWIEIDALHLAAQAFALGEARHHLQRVAEDHAVRPVLVVLIEFGLVAPFGMPLKSANRSGVSSSTVVLALLVARSRSSISTFGWTFSWM